MTSRPKWAVIQGDCKETLKKMKDNSIDSIVTDPPYELSFMNKKWDGSGIANDPELWAECLRVLKPGGYLLSFGGSRTYHRMACAVEDAGFEIRDSIDWLYSTGFPKSMSVSKEINKRSGKVDFEATPASGVGFMNADTADGYNVTKNRLIQKSESTDEAKVWDGWGTALKPAKEPIVVGRKPFEGPLYKNVLEHGTGGLNIDGCRVATSEQWNPSTSQPNESIGTFKTKEGTTEQHPSGRWPANIVFTHSIDCKKVGTTQTKAYVINRWKDGAKPFGGGAGHDFETVKTSETGSEDVDVYECVDGCPAKLLDEQSGVRASGVPGVRRKPHETNSMSGRLAVTGNLEVGYGDKGGASRFFNQLNWSEEDFFDPFLYIAKANKKERNAGLEHLETKSAGEVTGGRKEGSAGLQNPRAGAGRTSGNKNFHPTVKPVKLMEWLVRLVTPPGGTVLDPFTGSGTTGIAAVKQGFNFIGCELTEEYIPIAKGRISHAVNETFGSNPPSSAIKEKDEI